MTHTNNQTPTTTQAQARITYAQFEAACRAYLNRRHHHHQHSHVSSGESLSWLTYASGWEWLPPIHPGMVAFEGSACLSRSFSLLTPRSTPLLDTSSNESISEETILHPPIMESNEEDDEKKQELLTINQTITYSKTWSLPILYLSASNSAGEPLPLHHLKEHNVIFQNGTLREEKGLVEGEGVLAGGISIGDHPRTALPAFYLHPCRTASALSVLLGSSEEQQLEGCRNNRSSCSNDDKTLEGNIEGWAERDGEGEGADLGGEQDANQDEEKGFGGVVKCVVRPTKMGGTKEEEEEKEKEEKEKEEEGWRYIAAFISLCGSAVEMRST